MARQSGARNTRRIHDHTEAARNEGSEICTDILMGYSSAPRKDSSDATRAAGAFREGRLKLLQKKTGVMPIYIEWAIARLGIMASAFLAFGAVKIDMFGRTFFVDDAIV